MRYKRYGEIATLSRANICPIFFEKWRREILEARLRLPKFARQKATKRVWIKVRVQLNGKTRIVDSSLPSFRGIADRRR
jgi:hypothetical protein